MLFRLYRTRLHICIKHFRNFCQAVFFDKLLLVEQLLVKVRSGEKSSQIDLNIKKTNAIYQGKVGKTEFGKEVVIVKDILKEKLRTVLLWFRFSYQNIIQFL